MGIPSNFSQRPPDYLAWSICNLILCCLPLGIVALVFSIQSQSAANRGDMAEAERTSNTAKTCNMVATIGGGIAIVIVVIIFASTASTVGHS
jgi:hypothetical protein